MAASSRFRPVLRARRWALIVISLALLPAGPAQAQPDCPKPLRIVFLDKGMPPMLEGDGDAFAEPPGRFIEWTRAALRSLGCEAQLLRVPQRRLVVETAQGHADITFYLAHTPERAAQLAFPERREGEPDPRLAMGSTPVSLYVRADRRAELHWDGRRLLPATARVGIVGGGVEEPMARAAGWSLELALNHAASVAKLRRGQVDAALLPGITFHQDALSLPPALVALQPPLATVFFFAPVNREFQQRHPAFVKAFWERVCVAARGAAACAQ
jgi:ABC-type amino acid transport substrate-binding protein